LQQLLLSGRLLLAVLLVLWRHLETGLLKLYCQQQHEELQLVLQEFKHRQQQQEQQQQQQWRPHRHPLFEPAAAAGQAVGWVVWKSGRVGDGGSGQAVAVGAVRGRH
jgi:hypothetical protein